MEPSKRVSSRQRKGKKNTSISRRGRRDEAGNYVTQRQLKGGKIEVPTNPPSVSYQPWHTLTVVICDKSGKLSVSVSDLAAQIKRQIDPTKHALVDVPVINVKLHKVRAWNITGNMIALSVEDFTDLDQAKADTDALCGLVDTGSSMHIPAVGYDLPASHKEIVLRNGTNSASDSSITLFHVMSAKADSVIIYVNILYKFDGPVNISGFEDTMLNALHHIGSDVASIREAAERSEKRQTSIGSFIADGVVRTAPYVLPAIADATELRLDKIESLLRDAGLSDREGSLASFDDVSVLEREKDSENDA